MSSTTITTTPSRKRKPTGKDRSTWSKRARASIPRTVNMGKGPIAPKTVVTLKYTQSWLSDGTTYDTRWNLNSLFSPAYSGGHQPMGFDQYATFYNRYRVLKVKVRVDVGASTSYTGGPYKIVLVADNDNASLTTMLTSIEQTGASVYTSKGAGTITAVKTYYPHLITGVTKKEYQDDRFQALVSAKPTEDILLHVLLADIYNNTVATTTTQASIVMEYTCELFDPKPLAAS